MGRIARFLLTFALIVIAAITVARAAAAETVNVLIGVGDTVLQLNGTTSPYAFVAVVDGTSVVGTTTAGANGDFAQTFTAFLPGVHHIKAYSRDTQNRTTDIVEAEINVAEHFTTSLTIFLPPTLELSNTSVQTGGTILIRGATLPFAAILLTVDSTTVQITADATGEWQYPLATALMIAGTHSLYAIAVDPLSSSQSYSTDSRSFTILQPTQPTPITPPSSPPPVPPGAVIPEPPRIAVPANGAAVNENHLIAKGTSQAGTRIELYNNDQLLGAAFADTTGNWYIPFTLTEQFYRLRAKACLKTLCSNFSETIQISHLLGSGIGFEIKLDRYWYETIVRTPSSASLRIKGGNPPYQLHITWGDGSNETISTLKNEWLATHTYHRAGRYNVHILAHDKDGRASQLAYTIEVKGQIALPWWRQVTPWLLSLLALGALAVYFRMLSRHKLLAKRNGTYYTKSNGTQKTKKRIR